MDEDQSNDEAQEGIDEALTGQAVESTDEEPEEGAEDDEEAGGETLEEDE